MASTKEKRFTPGQVVLLFEPYGKREPREVAIERVGRTLAYVKLGWQEKAFRIEDGYERRPANAGGTGSVIRTPEEWAARQHRDELTKRLAEHNLGPKGYGHLQQTTATLEKIVAILDEETN